MAEPGRSQALELGEPPLDTAHDIALNLAVSLGHDEGIREPSIEVPVKELAVILWETLHIDVHDPA
jgi:hypothetical protein